MHFALEDFHGYNRFGHPRLAFDAYVKATQAHQEYRLPDDWQDLHKLGQDMMDYYIVWLQQRTNSIQKTFWFNGEPQVEVNFRFKIPFDASKWGYDEVVYSGTIDRVTIDNDDPDLLWINDYKSAQTIQTMHYSTDPQIGVYMWGAPYIYDKPIAGFKYQQHRKAVPNPGRILVKGGVSVDKQQLTSRLMYRKTLEEVYGSVDNAPDANIQFLNYLTTEETEEYDKFIRIDKVYRNEVSAQSEGVKIMMELEDMLNPQLPLYPNPVRECATYCPFYSPCIALDDGSDWQHMISQMYEQRETVYDSWRKKIVWPDEAKQETVSNWLDDDIEVNP